MKITGSAGKACCQPVIGIFQVGQINIHLPLQLPESLHPLIAAAVVYHRYRQFRLQGGEYGGQKMGGGHQVDVLRAPGNQVFHQTAQSGAVHGHAHRPAGDLPVLAVAAAQGAAAEENGAAAAFSGQGRLLPLVEHTFCHKGSGGTAAEAGFIPGTVCAAFPGTEFAVYIIHEFSTSFGSIIAVFSSILNPGFTNAGSCDMIN